MSSWAERFVAWLVRRVGAPVLLTLALLLAVLGSLAAGLARALPLLQSAGLAVAALAGLLAGWALARTRLPGWAAAALLAAGGLALALIPLLLSRPQLPALLEAARRLAADLVAWQIGQPAPDPGSFLALLGGTALDLGQSLLGAVQWAAALASGAARYDRQAAAIFWRLVLWAVAAWAAWAVRRRNQPLAAVLPALVLLAGILAFSRSPALPLAPALIATLLLLAWHSFQRRESAWRAAAIDHAEGLSLDLLVWSLGLSIVLVEAALLISALSPQQMLAFSREWLRQRSAAEQRFGEALGLQIAPTPGSAPAGPGGQSGLLTGLPEGILPRLHLLGSGPELSQQPVMRVRAALPAALTGTGSPPLLYWRSQTYDLYTGRGWTSSPVELGQFAAGQPIAPVPAAPGWIIEQRIEPLTGLQGQVFAAGQLLSLDQPATLAWRAAETAGQDLFAAALVAPARAYTARSWLPGFEPGLPGAKPAAGQTPAWLSARYLQLPASLPERVTNLAQAITAGQTDPYAKALAIESYLRRFPYSLELPPPPAAGDVADYFLFDLQRGYCDYYATAMVVLARASGLPARLAQGYATGIYDPQTASYDVSAAEAHSWPEVYLPGTGWVSFEPTAARPLPPRQAASGALPNRPLAPVTPPVLLPVFLAAAALGLAALLAFLAWLAWDAWRLGRLPPGQAIGESYHRLRHAGQQLGLSPSPAETPGEFAAALCSLPAAGQPERDRAAALAGLYARACYARSQPGEAERRQALALWRAQRRRWFQLRLRCWVSSLPFLRR